MRRRGDLGKTGRPKGPRGRPRKDWKRFASWCERRGETPLPAHWATIVFFIRESRGGGVDSKALEHVLEAVQRAHLARGFEDPLAHERVRRELEAQDRVEEPSGLLGNATEVPVSSGEPGVSPHETSSGEPGRALVPRRELSRIGLERLPTQIAAAGERAARRFVEFFAATIRNRNTRAAYARAVRDFLAWCEERGIRRLEAIEPVVVAAYIEKHPGSTPTVKQHLAAIRMLFDWLVTGQVLAQNPAHSVRGPRHVVTRGKTPVLTADQARTLLDSIPLARKDGSADVVGLRDRALIGLMVYSFARVSAAVAMRIEDYYLDGKRWWFRLHEKGGKRHAVPAHHNAEAYLDAYLEIAGHGDEKRASLFRTASRERALTLEPMTRNDVLRMVKRRARDAGLPVSTSCHTFRATGITTYLENGGTIENAQAIAAHSSPRTTKLYDRTSDEITLDEVERIQI